MNENLEDADMATRTARLESVVYPMVGVGKLEAMSPTNAVIVFSQPPLNHVLHALLSFFTCGTWIMVWALMAATRKKSVRIAYTVDEWGLVWSDDGPDHSWVMRLGPANQAGS